jgi:hypothetical protein
VDRKNFTANTAFLVLPILRFGRFVLSPTESYFANQITDVSGALLFARQLKSMNMLLDIQTTTGAPEGYSVMNAQRVVLGFNTVILWLLTKVASPHGAIALFCIIGLTITGLAAKWIATEFGISRTVGLICGLLAQSLPWILEKSTNHITYMFSGLVLVPIGLSLRSISQRCTSKHLLQIACFSLLCLSVDPYLGIYSIIGSTLGLVVTNHPSRLSRLLGFAFAVLIIIGISFDSSTFSIGNEIVRTLNARGMNKDDLFFFGSVTDYLTPQPGNLFFGGRKMSEVDRDFLADYVNYFGSLNLILFAGGLVTALRSSSRQWKTLSLVMLFFLVASLKFTISRWTWIPAQSLWLIAPGLRVVSRYGIVAQLIGLIFVAKAVDTFLGNLDHRPRKRLVSAVLVLCISIVDLNPLAQLNSEVNTASFSSLSRELRRTDILAILPDNPARTSRWVGFASLVPSKITNSELDATTLESLSKMIEISDYQAAWCEANRLETTHLLLVEDLAGGAVPNWEPSTENFRIKNSSYFTEVARAESPIFHPNYQVNVVLYRVEQINEGQLRMCGST